MKIAPIIKTHLLNFLLTAAFATAGPIGYVINFSGQFGTMDLGTGAFTPIGSGTPNTPDGIAGAPGGPTYTVDGTNGHLLRISSNGTITDVGNTGTGSNNGPFGVSIIGGLTNGSLFALDFANRLFSIDTSNGTLGLLGTLALPTQEDAYIGNMTTSLNGNGNLLFYTLEISDGPNQIGPTLFRINPVTLAVSSVPLTAPSRIIGSGFVNGVMYAFTEFGEILTVDPMTGSTTVAAFYDSGSTAANPGPPLTGVFGVVATPEPASASLVVGGLLLLLVGSRRKS